MKTTQDINNKLYILAIPHTVFAGDTWRFATGEQVYSPRRGFFNLTMRDEGSIKYNKITNKTAYDIGVDLTYHWLDNFKELSSFSALRSRMKDPALSGSFATTVAVNKYIANNNSSPEEIKELLSGSKWRWVKLETGEYIQKSLYPIDGYYPYFTRENNPSFFTTRLLSTLKSAKTILTERAQREYEQQEAMRREEERRQQAAALELRGYNTRATDFFPFKKGRNAKYNTFLGIELELEQHSPQEFKKCLNSIKDHAIFKRDGSLTNGVEICTAPATLDVHKEAFSKFFEQMISNRSSLQAKDSCGMHIHIDRSNLSTLHVANMCLFLNNQDNEQQIQKIAGRAANTYCKVKKHRYYDFISGQTGDRYHRVNLTPEKTVEFRMFASTTNYQDFCKRLEFTQAVVDYTRPGETAISCKNIPKWELFKEYVLKHAAIYPTLVKGL